MKNAIVGLTVAAATLFTGTTFADPSWPNADSAPRFMLYAHKSLGHSSRQAAQKSNWALGLSLQREFNGRDLHALGVAVPQAVSLLDFRFTPGSSESLSINGVNLGSGGSSDDREGRRNLWILFGVTIGALAVSCLADYWPCVDHDSNSGNSTTPTAQ